MGLDPSACCSFTPRLPGVVREGLTGGAPAVRMPGSCGWPGRWTRGSSQCPSELVARGLLVSTQQEERGEQGPLGGGQEFVVTPIGNLLNGSLRVVFHRRKGADFQPHHATCPRGPAATSPRGGLAR